MTEETPPVSFADLDLVDELLRTAEHRTWVRAAAHPHSLGLDGQAPDLFRAKAELARAEADRRAKVETLLSRALREGKITKPSTCCAHRASF